MIRIVYPLLAIILCVFQGFAQDQTAIDLLNLKAKYHQDHDADSIIFFANEALQQSREINYPAGEMLALANLGFASYTKGDYDQGIAYCHESLNTAKTTAQPLDTSMASQVLGLIYINQSKYEQAIEIFEPLVIQAKAHKDLDLLSDAYGNLGLAYLNMKDYQKALNFLTSANDLHKKNVQRSGMVWVGINLGRIFLSSTNSTLLPIISALPPARVRHLEINVRYCTPLPF